MSEETARTSWTERSLITVFSLTLGVALALFVSSWSARHEDSRSAFLHKNGGLAALAIGPLCCQPRDTPIIIAGGSLAAKNNTGTPWKLITGTYKAKVDNSTSSTTNTASNDFVVLSQSFMLPSGQASTSPTIITGSGGWRITFFDRKPDSSRNPTPVVRLCSFADCANDSLVTTDANFKLNPNNLIFYSTLSGSNGHATLQHRVVDQNGNAVELWMHDTDAGCPGTGQDTDCDRPDAILVEIKNDPHHTVSGTYSCPDAICHVKVGQPFP